MQWSVYTILAYRAANGSSSIFFT